MYKIGSSRDIHNLVKGKEILVGNHKIMCDFSVDAISDGDVLLHAISESILGALSLGDLGDHFKKVDKSIKIIKYALEMLKKHNYEIVNLDTLIICEHIMISPHKSDIKSSLVKILNISPEQLNIKATRWENKKNFTFEADCTILLKKKL